jgi:ATP-binding cassette subfamily B protein
VTQSPSPASPTTPGSESTAGLRPLLRLAPWIGRHRGLVGGALIAFAGARLLEAGVPLCLREGIDRIDRGDFDVTGPALALVGLVLARLLVVSAARIGIRRAGIGVAFDLRQALFQRLQHQGSAFFARHTIGDMMTRAVADVSLVRRLISVGTIMLVVMIYATLVGFAAMFWLAPELAWVVAPPLPFVAVYALHASRRMKLSSSQVQARLSRLTDRTQETFGGIRTLQAMARESGIEAAFERDNRAYADAFREQARLGSAMTAVMPTLAAAGTLIVLGWGGHLVLTGAISKGTFVAFFTYVAMVIQPMRVAGFLVNLIQRAVVGAERIFEVLDLPDEIPDRPSGRTPAALKGALSLHGCTVRYPGADRDALSDLDLAIAPGERIAIMGPVGAGKSTLLALFPRLVDAPAGTVCIDDHPVTDWPLAQLRHDVVLVPQDAFLFGQPLGENLSYDEPSRDEDLVLDAADVAAFRRTIENLPAGLGTLVGERGVTLSGGQRQRATLARGVIRDAPVLLLDDCFAAVDTETEEQILQALMARRRGRTTVLVTHRVSTARRADRVIVMEDGRIVASGPHELLARQDGWYARLAALQAEAPADAGDRVIAP